MLDSRWIVAPLWPQVRQAALGCGAFLNVIHATGSALERTQIG